MPWQKSRKMKKQAERSSPKARTIARLQPGSAVGIIGSGQLGRMLALTTARLGLRAHIYAEEAASPASEVAARATEGSYLDLTQLEQFAATVDVITYEFENVPIAAVRHLEKIKPVYPPPRALEIAQDRLSEKQFIQNLGIAVAPFETVSNEAELAAAMQRLGTPAILKTRWLGYDGKGQVTITPATAPLEAYQAVAGAPAILEGFVRFEREISVILARGVDPSDMHSLTEVIYDIPVNTHKDGILQRSSVPAPITAETKCEAEDIARRIAHALDYVGVLAVELFDTGAGGGGLIVNEIAPRVHNSGHWTMDACHTDQFENHIRAIAGWPLGNSQRHANVEMTNLIGQDVEQWLSLLTQPDIVVHLYGKNKTMPGRKMGHVNKLNKFLD